MAGRRAVPERGRRSCQGRSLLGGPAGLPDHGQSLLGLPDQGRSPRGGAFLSCQGRSPRGGPLALFSHGLPCPERGAEGGRVEAPDHGQSLLGLPDQGRSPRGGAFLSCQGRSPRGGPLTLFSHGLPCSERGPGRGRVEEPCPERGAEGGRLEGPDHGQSLLGLPDQGRSPRGAAFLSCQGRSPRGGPPALFSHGLPCPERGAEGGRVEAPDHGRSLLGLPDHGRSPRGGTFLSCQVRSPRGGNGLCGGRVSGRASDFGVARAGGGSRSSRERSLWGRCFFLSLSKRARGSLCSPPGRHSRSRGAPPLRSRAFRPAHCDCSGESHSFPRANHFISIVGLVRRSWVSVGRSSSCLAARNAVGLPSIRMVQ